ncbi:hypothetical protein EJ07DRAFT_157494 [Lizonia empirigonia]|nr:hypothetical protein EJ07DRAFT_157494 [Lizonia empirigonia]
MSLLSTPRFCNLCHFPIQAGEKIQIVTHPAKSLEDEPTNSVLSQSRSLRVERSQSFQYHQLCVQICLPFLEPRSLVKLGQSLRPALLMDDPPGPEHALQILKHSCYPKILSSKVENHCVMEPNCECLECMFRHLSKLPTEVFTEIIFMAEPSNISKLLTIFGETSKLLSELTNRRARDITLSCQGDVFQTSIKYGGKSYVTGLYDQEVPHSEKIKSRDTSCDYLAIWMDKIGVTQAEFLHSTFGHEVKHMKVNDNWPSIYHGPIKCRNCWFLNAKHPLTIRSKREWVYTVAISGARVNLRSKGVFVERIWSPLLIKSQIFWDCAKSSMLLPRDSQEKFPLATPYEDLFLRYVTVQNASAISIAFASGRLIAITSHQSEDKKTCFYEEADIYTLCMYLPLSNNEKIEAIWIARHKDSEINMGVRSLIVKTQMKTIWLGHYITPEIQSELQLEQIADESVNALYCSDPRFPRSIVGAQPQYHAASPNPLVPPNFPTYRTPFPGFVTYFYNMYYSEAPLEGLVKVQVCMDDGYCLGILLDYGSHSRTVGQYRYDRKISSAYEPNCIGLIQERHVSNPRIRLRILDEKSPQSETRDPDLRLMHGIIVWWYGKDISFVNVLPSN